MTRNANRMTPEGFFMTRSSRRRHIIGFGTLLCLLASFPVFAASRTWDGGGGDDNWTTAGNWSADTVPGSSDTVTFDGTSTKACAIDANVSVAGFTIASGYTGTITQGSGKTVTVGASDFSQSDGTFAGSADNITFNGSFTLAGGTFTAGNQTITAKKHWTYTSGTLAAGTSTVVFCYDQTITGSHTLNNVTFANGGSTLKTATIASGTTLTVSGTLALSGTSGDMIISGSGTVEARGDITESDRDFGGTATILVNGTGNQTLTGSATETAGSLPNFQINKSSGTLSLAGTIRTKKNWTVAAGTLDAGTSTVVFCYDQTITGSHTLYNVTFKNSGSTLKTATIASGTTLIATGTLALSGTSGDMIVSGGGTIEARGDITESDRNFGGTATILVNGTGNQTLTGSATETAGSLPNLTINKSTGTLSLAGTIRTMKNWTYTAGTLDAGTSTVVFCYEQTITGSHTLYNVMFSNSGTSLRTIALASGTTLTATGTLTCASANGASVVISGGTLEAEGDINVTTSALFYGSTAFNITGGANQTWTYNGGTNTFRYSPTVNKTGGEIALASNLSLNYSGQDLAVTAGTFNLAGYNLTVSDVLSVGTSGTLKLQGGETVTRGSLSLSAGSTVIYNGSGNYTGLPLGSSYKNLTFDGAGAWTLTSALSVGSAGEDLTLTQGTLDLAGYNLTVNDVLSVGASGTLKLQGGETITRGSLSLAAGSTVIYNGGGNYTGLLLGNAYSNVTFDGSGAWTLPSALAASGNLTLASGVLNAGGNTITLAGNWTRSGGTYTPAGNTVILSGGNQTISGSTTFYNLTKEVTTPATLTFAAGEKQTVTGTLDLNGASGNLLSLRSSATGAAWQVDPQGIRSVRYADVKDSDNTNAVAVRAYTSENSGNDTNWVFAGADPYRWTGGGADENWTTGANWEGGTAPGSSYTATFDGTTSKNCAINANLNVAGIAIQSDYLGTITQGSGKTITVGASDFTQASGTFTGSADSITFNGSFTLSGGTFNAGNQTITAKKDWTCSGGTLDAGTSTVVFCYDQTITGSHTLYNVTFANGGSTLKTATIASGTTLTATGTLALSGTSGDMIVSGSGTIEAQGNITESSRDFGGTATILVNGTGNQTLTGSATETAGSLPNLTINKSSGTLSLAGTIRTKKNWTYTAGTLDAGTSTVVFCYDQTITGSHTLYNVTFKNSGTTLKTATIASGTTLTATGTLALSGTSGDMIVSGGGTIEARGDITESNRNFGGTATILVNGTGNQTLTGTATETAGSLPNLTINKSSGTLSLAGTIRTMKNWTYTAGTLDAGTSTVVFCYDQTITGSHSLYNITFANSGSTLRTMTLSSGTTLTAAGALSCVSSNGASVVISGGTLAAQGNITTAAALSSFGTAAVSLVGSANQTITAVGMPGGTVTIAKSGGTATLAADLNLIGEGQNLIIAQGTLDLAGYNLAVNNEIAIGASGTLALLGSETVARASFVSDPAGTVVFRGDGDSAADTYTVTALSESYGNLVIVSTDGATDVFKLASPLAVAGNLTLTAGDLDTDAAGNYPISVAGNWTNSGTFHARAGSVALTGGNQTLSGSTTFYDLTKQTTGAATLTLPAGGTQTVNGVLTLIGTTGNKLALRSSATGTAWNVDPEGLRRVRYVDAEDGNNTATAALVAVASTNSGNNTNWSFASADPFRWTGGGANANWTTGGNWEGSAAPGTSDIALFDGTCATNCSPTIDAAVSVGGIEIQADYTGTITQTTASVTTGIYGIAQAGGAFSGGSAGIALGGPLALSGGTLTATSGTLSMARDWVKTGGTFSANSGTVVFSGAVDQNVTSDNSAFANITVSKTGGTLFAQGGDLSATGNVAISAGGLNANGHDIFVGGDWTKTGGTVTLGTQTVTFNGAGSQTLTSGGTGSDSAFYNLTVAKLSGTLSLATDAILVNGTLEVQSGALSQGALDATTSFLVVDGGTFTCGAGVLDVNGPVTISDGSLSGGSGAFTVSGDWNQTGGTFSGNSGTVTFDGAGDQTVTATSAFNNLKLAGTNRQRVWLPSATNGEIEVTNTANPVEFETGFATSALTLHPGNYLEFLSGATFTVGTLTANGSAGNHIVLRPMQTSAWNLLVTSANPTASYVSVLNSNASGGNEITATNSSDEGGNTNWDFGGSGTPPVISYSPTADIFTSTSTAVTMSADPSQGTTIYYTTDGTNPTTGSSVYSTPVTISADTEFRAIAVNGGSTSQIYGKTYYHVGTGDIYLRKTYGHDALLYMGEVFRFEGQAWWPGPDGVVDEMTGDDVRMDGVQGPDLESQMTWSATGGVIQSSGVDAGGPWAVLAAQLQTGYYTVSLHLGSTSYTGCNNIVEKGECKKCQSCFLTSGCSGTSCSLKGGCSGTACSLKGDCLGTRCVKDDAVEESKCDPKYPDSCPQDEESSPIPLPTRGKKVELHAAIGRGAYEVGSFGFGKNGRLSGLHEICETSATGVSVFFVNRNYGWRNFVLDTTDQKYKMAGLGGGYVVKQNGVYTYTSVEGEKYTFGKQLPDGPFGAKYIVTEDKDASDNTISYVYNPNGTQITITDASQNTYGVTLANGMISQISETPQGSQNTRTWSYLYDTNNFLAKETYVNESQFREFDFDIRGNLTSKTDYRGNATAYEYSTAGEVTKMTHPTEDVVTFAWSQVDADYTMTITDPQSNVTTQTLDTNHSLLATNIVHADGLVETYERDAFGYVTKETRKPTANPADDIVTTHTYDSRHNLTRTVVDPDGLNLVTDYTYDNDKNMTSMTDPNGVVTSYEYDAAHHMTEQVRDVGGLALTKTWAYDAYGQLTTETDELGKTRTYTYDSFGRVTEVEDELTHSEFYSYDIWGNRTAVTDRNGNTTAYQYDANNRLTLVTDPASFTESYTYDANGNRTGVVDKNGVGTTYVYDSLNRVIQITGVGGNSCSSCGGTAMNGQEGYYYYDSAGRLTQFVNVLGQPTNFSYDAVGRMTQKVTDPNNLALTEIAEYDKLGRKTKETRVNDAVSGESDDLVTYFSYDKASRLTQQSRLINSGTVNVTFTYDDAGNLTSQTDENGKTSYTVYDAVGRVTQTQDTGGLITEFAYDDRSQLLTQVADPGTGHFNITTTYTYDDAGRRLTMTLPEGGVVEYTYDDVGNLLTEEDPLHHVTTYTYDNRNLLETVTDPASNVTAYEYDGLGNRTEMTDAAGTVTTWQYCQKSFLTQVVEDVGTSHINRTTAYTYDLLGHRATEVDAASVTTAYVYDSGYRLTSVTRDYGGKNVPESMAYDSLGRVTSRTDAGGNATTFLYDQLSRITNESRPDGGETTFAYDNTANVLTKTVKVTGGGSPTYFVTTYTYDNAYRQSQMIEDAGSGHLNIETDRYYDTLHRLTTLRAVNGAQNQDTVYTYDDENHVLTETYPDSGVVVYTYDLDGKLETRTDQKGQVTKFYYSNRDLPTTKIYDYQGQNEGTQT
ncbi:MAG: FN3 associated domain-containing protein, partial [Planctomycetota bacterium]